MELAIFFVYKLLGGWLILYTNQREYMLFFLCFVAMWLFRALKYDKRNTPDNVLMFIQHFSKGRSPLYTLELSPKSEFPPELL